MDSEPAPMQSTKPFQQTPPELRVQQSIPPHAAPLKNQKLLWILAGIIVLLTGIGIGMFLMQPVKKNTSQSLESANQNPTPETNVSIFPVSSINMSAYPTVSQSSLPLGDYKYTITGPKKGYIYLCRVMNGGGGAQESGSWITGTTWNYDEKPHVQGAVSWPNAAFSNKVSGSTRTLT